jgi:hypothetical protein
MSIRLGWGIYPFDGMVRNISIVGVNCPMRPFVVSVNHKIFHNMIVKGRADDLSPIKPYCQKCISS